MNHSAILHIDGDDFFAAAARLKDPALRNRPLIVGHLQSRGTVVSSSYEIRHSGVCPGLTMAQAGRMCPEAVLVQVDWDFLERLSAGIRAVVGRYSPLVEPAGTDALFVDYSGCHRLFGPAVDFAARIQKEIREQVAIGVSVGLAADKAVSVVACRAAKMGMLESVAAGEEQRFLSGCPIRWLPGIDARLDDYFTELGIRTIGELAQVPAEIMEHLLGSDGKTLALRARGLEGSRVRSAVRADMPMITSEFIEDTIDPATVLARLAAIASDLGNCLRRIRQSPRCIVLRIGYSDFRTGRIQIPLTPPSNRDPDLFRAAREAFSRLYRRRVRIREISIQARCLATVVTELPFGDAERHNRWNRALIAADRIRHKYAPGKLLLGAALV